MDMVVAKEAEARGVGSAVKHGRPVAAEVAGRRVTTVPCSGTWNRHVHDEEEEPSQRCLHTHTQRKSSRVQESLMSKSAVRGKRERVKPL